MAVLLLRRLVARGWERAYLKSTVLSADTHLLGLRLTLKMSGHSLPSRSDQSCTSNNNCQSPKAPQRLKSGEFKLIGGGEIFDLSLGMHQVNDHCLLKTKECQSKQYLLQDSSAWPKPSPLSQATRGQTRYAAAY